MSNELHSVFLDNFFFISVRTYTQNLIQIGRNMFSSPK